MYLAALRKLTVSVLSANFKKMEVLPFFLQLHQVFSFEIVVWDSKLLRHINWGKLGPFKTTKNKDRSKNVNCTLFPPGPSFIIVGMHKKASNWEPFVMRSVTFHVLSHC